MAGVHVAPAVNDENSSALGGGLLASQLKAPAAAGLQQQQPPVKQQQLQGSSLKSARKAFGNITNSGRGDASAAKQQQPRRAFGDITNSAVKAPAGGGGLGGATSKKQGSSSLFSSSQKQPTATKKAPAPPVPPPPAAASSSSAPAQASAAAAAEQASSQAQWWEGLEPERAAGKTWEQQEADREAAMEAEAIRSADEMWDSVLRAGFLQELLPVPPVPSDDEEACVVMMPEQPLTLARHHLTPAVPDVPIEELMYDSNTTDFASLLPDITLSDDDVEEDEEDERRDGMTGAAAAADGDTAGATEQLAQLSLGAGECSSPQQPVGCGSGSGAQQTDCRSPDIQPC